MKDFYLEEKICVKIIKFCLFRHLFLKDTTKKTKFCSYVDCF